jgi:hypothetical protein
MDCPGLYACVSAAHNNVLKTSIIWCLNVTHESIRDRHRPPVCLNCVATGTLNWPVVIPMLIGFSMAEFMNQNDVHASTLVFIYIAS